MYEDVSNKQFDIEKLYTIWIRFISKNSY